MGLIVQIFVLKAIISDSKYIYLYDHWYDAPPVWLIDIWFFFMISIVDLQAQDTFPGTPFLTCKIIL